MVRSSTSAASISTPAKLEMNYEFPFNGILQNFPIQQSWHQFQHFHINDKFSTFGIRCHEHTHPALATQFHVSKVGLQIALQQNLLSCFEVTKITKLHIIMFGLVLILLFFMRPFTVVPKPHRLHSSQSNMSIDIYFKFLPHVRRLVLTFHCSIKTFLY